jgi:metal-responsive CopG/Arc/MetJ family transcriptional regulator
MPSKKPKILLILDDEFLSRIDDFRFGNRINTRSEAIRRLIEESLKKYDSKKQPRKKE